MVFSYRRIWTSNWRGS